MHIKILGSGSDLVMLHGWSMHSGVWRDLAEKLAENYRVHLVDLPGHGQSDWEEDVFEPARLMQLLQQQLPDKASWMGWSLGGLICLQLAANFPDKISKLVLLAATPLFVATVDWPCAMPPALFEQFSRDLDSDEIQTLKRFVMLLAHGAEHGRDTIRILTKHLTTAPVPHPQALHAGLEILLYCDARPALAAVDCPLLLLMGDCDTLIPTEMIAQAKKINPGLSASLIIGAGHAPFISHPAQCQRLIEQFLSE